MDYTLKPGDLDPRTMTQYVPTDSMFAPKLGSVVQLTNSPAVPAEDDWLIHKPTLGLISSMSCSIVIPEWVRKALKFRGVAEEIAKLSKDRSTKVGAVALGHDFEILGLGYNGFPRGINDDIETRHDRPAKYRYTSHAEENVVAAAARNGVSLKGSTILVTSLFPCTTCSRLMIQSGVVRVLAPKVDNARWAVEADTALEMLREAGVLVHFYSIDTTGETA